MKKYLLFLAIFAAGALAGIAAARRKPPPVNPCEPDGEEFCAAAGTPQDFLKCLRENKTSLGEACLERLVFAGTTMSVIRERGNCREDTALFCKDSGDKPIQCLFMNEDGLSEPCRQDMRQLKRALAIIPKRLRATPDKRTTSQD